MGIVTWKETATWKEVDKGNEIMKNLPWDKEGILIVVVGLVLVSCWITALLYLLGKI